MSFGPVRAAINEESLANWMALNVQSFTRNTHFEVKQFLHGQSNPTYLISADGEFAFDVMIER